MVLICLSTFTSAQRSPFLSLVMPQSLRTASGLPWSELAVADADRAQADGEGAASAEVASMADRGKMGCAETEKRYGRQLDDNFFWGGSSTMCPSDCGKVG